jgi:ribonuclease P protein component
MPTFPKSERLCGKNAFEALFQKGKKFFLHPFKVLHIGAPGADAVAQIAIIVPKKIAKKAVSRNRLKRQIREAYRLEKEQFINSLKNKNKGMVFAVIYIGEEKADFELLREKINLILTRLSSN